MICKLDDKLESDIPDNKFFLRYGPGYELTIERNNLDDLNSVTEMENIYQTIKGNKLYRFPGVNNNRY